MLKKYIVNFGNRLFNFFICSSLLSGIAFADVTMNTSLLVQLDNVVFFGQGSQEDDGQNTFSSGATLRRATMILQGNLGGFGNGKFSYFTQLNFPTNSSTAMKVDQAFLKYSNNGFTLQFGQMYVPFGLENSSSAANGVFLEQSLMSAVTGGAQTFITKGHFGLLLGYTSDIGTLSFAAVVPEVYKETKGRNSDRVGFVFRTVLIPINSNDGTIHIGLNVRHENIGPCCDDGTEIALIGFGARPELRSRSGAAAFTNQLVRTEEHPLNGYQVAGFELAGKYSSLTIQNEFLMSKVNWENLEAGKYFGWNTQISYVLTGEERPYNSVKGVFGDPKVVNRYGSYELAFRFSGMNLDKPYSDDFINAGNVYAFTAGLNCFLNNNVKLQINYVNTNFRYMDIARDSRTLHGFGLRIQMAV